MTEVKMKTVHPKIGKRELPIVGQQPMDEKEEKYLREELEFEFYNLEEPGLSQKFTYGDGHVKQKFIMFPGNRYRVPRFIARHIESRMTPKYEWRPDGTGVMAKKLVSWTPRFQMRPIFER